MDGDFRVFGNCNWVRVHCSCGFNSPRTEDYLWPLPSLEVVIWRVSSLIGNAVAVSFIGLLLGQLPRRYLANITDVCSRTGSLSPLYPIAMNQAGRVLPSWMVTSSIGWIAGLGQTGSAFLPFVTGAVASKAGISSLQPL